MQKLISATIAGTLLATGISSTLNNPIAKAENIQKIQIFLKK